MEQFPEHDSLEQARSGAHKLGIALCVVWPILLEIVLSKLPQGEASAPSVVETVGHSFTGLVVLAAAYIFWRRRRAAGLLSVQGPQGRAASLRRETLVASLIFGACSLLGPLYYGIAGAPGTRHARSYIAAVPIMFFAFAPRLSSWAPGPPAHRRERA